MFFCDFLKLEVVLRHKSIKMITNSDLSINFLQKYVHGIDE